MKQNELTSALNALLADHLVLVMKLHNYHWNIRGRNFRCVHELTQTYYEYFFKNYDELAERILQIGGTPPVTISSSLAIARIQEEGGSSFTEFDVLDGIRIDFDFLRISSFAAVAMAGRAGDAITEGILLNFVAWLEKELWMLRLATEEAEESTIKREIAA